jgi:putative acetyltransferase
MRIRPVLDTDRAGVRRVVAAAFGRSDEAALVDALRADGDAAIERVAAEDDGTVLGHVLFSPLAIERAGEELTALALAPVAVDPAQQRRGIGSALIEAGIAAARAAGCPAILVLGNPDYDPRFGFDAARAATLRAPFDGPAFMALELAPGVLERGGAVRYAAAFGLRD